MELTQEKMERHLQRLKPLLTGCSLEVARKGQEALGLLLSRSCRSRVHTESLPDYPVPCCRILPADREPVGTILYLHGGGYTCGGLDYAKGFGSVLAAATGAAIYCPAYRLAPEHPFPAALEDALAAYRALPERPVLCGESAGGGLIYAVCRSLLDSGSQPPLGFIAISPWTDLTASGASYKENLEKDPSMTPERLGFFASCYTDDPQNPLVSPLLGNLEGFPPSLIFVGGNEVMLDDSRSLHKKLLSSGCQSTLEIAPGLWHGYVLYCLKERQCDLEAIAAFAAERFGQKKFPDF